MTTIPPVDTSHWVVSATELYGTVEATDETEAKRLAEELVAGSPYLHSEVHIRPLARGTNPSPTEAHEPRVVEDPREHMNGIVSEIEDGVLVAWDTCSGCKKHYSVCKCSTGPSEPKYISEWRSARFAKSIKDRLDPPKPDYTEPTIAPPVRADRPKETAEIADTVDDGMDAALAAVKAAKEDQ